MPNDIRNLVNNQQVANARQRENAKSVTPNDSGSANGKSSAPAGEDNVSLTETALHVQEVERRLAEAPVVDRERVEQIRQAISEGRYSIRAEHIAKKLFDLERFLGGNQ